MICLSHITTNKQYCQINHSYINHELGYILCFFLITTTSTHTYYCHFLYLLYDQGPPGQ